MAILDALQNPEFWGVIIAIGIALFNFGKGLKDSKSVRTLTLALDHLQQDYDELKTENRFLMDQLARLENREAVEAQVVANLKTKIVEYESRLLARDDHIQQMVNERAGLLLRIEVLEERLNINDRYNNEVQ